MLNTIDLAEAGYLPDWLVRIGIRRLLTRRRYPQSTDAAAFAQHLRTAPLAVETQSANDQHYEVAAEFFESCLGPRLKYSSCLFLDSSTSLAEAEEHMLQLTCERAEITDGMSVLELGCGWGSLTLWIAEHFPNCAVTAVSNSNSQRKFIERRAHQQGFSNIRVITSDMREFATDDRFDRIVSIEMFEHMRNYALLFSRVANWLTSEGKAFVHVFCHRDTPYLFDSAGSDNWMGRHFFTGGVMPSWDLFSHFDECLSIDQRWVVDGLHYWRTCESWLRNLDCNRAVALEALSSHSSPKQAKLAIQRWRMFFMACAELFRYRHGLEWFVGHYLFARSATGRLNCSDADRSARSVNNAENLHMTKASEPYIDGVFPRSVSD